MYLQDLLALTSIATNTVTVIEHPYLKCFIQVDVDLNYYSDTNTVKTIHVEKSTIYVKLDFDKFIRNYFDENLSCCLKWHQIYTAKTVQELMLLDEKGHFVTVLDNLKF